MTTPSLPKYLNAVITPVMEVVLEWASAIFYQRLLAGQEDHQLLVLHQLIDFDPIIDLTLQLSFDSLLTAPSFPMAFLSDQEIEPLAISRAEEVYFLLQHLRHMASDFQALGPSTTQWLNKQMALLDKILSDEFEVQIDAEGRLLSIALLDEKKKGQYRIASVVEPEATWSNMVRKSILATTPT